MYYKRLNVSAYPHRTSNLSLPIAIPGFNAFIPAFECRFYYGNRHYIVWINIMKTFLSDRNMTCKHDF